ncbi:pyridoxal-phosphate dependent enzyme [Coralloluteibacterium stylophorae]|uniref:Pyridoxal-phosphate dependent enzyme n=1 Tax=Coralloluteibacterium stylophorae TaxID=1776034 RepID=A0A8J7VWH1_9GAMM|nr:pyridoxal-phosphate dependent enzyme [Coralloluteibacterium stylophorae]MBS7457135.1 pyridoxal-phosphate dependent enzyme [Coralloluteibacterium stylophorae]
MPHADRAPTLSDIHAAAARIAPLAHVTPVLRSRSLDAIAGCELHFKCEHLQRIGAFKFRGAANAVFSLDEAAAARGVVTQSSGNHGAAIALACRLRGIPATVVVPRSAPAIKLAAIRDFGARIVPCDTSQAARDAATAEVLRESGGELIHPFNDARVIAGQGTATLELLAQAPGLDTVLAPVSGGGLLSGTAIAAHAHDAGIRVFAAEPEGAADAHASFVSGARVTGRHAETICDGLRAELGTLTFPIVREHVEDILLVSDDEVVAAMRLVWERLKQAIEPSAAVTLAAVLRHRGRFAGRRVGLILSGGNVDLDALPWRTGGTAA